MSILTDTRPDSALARLAQVIADEGNIPTVRVSSAQAKGLAGKYPYWGAVRYQIRLRRRDGWPTNRPLERASSDRRSERLAELDAERIAEREGRLFCGRLGALKEADALSVLSILAVWEAQAQSAESPGEGRTA